MGFPALQIRDKITIPFILLAFAGISTTALLSVNLISKALEQRFEKQLVVASDLLSRPCCTRRMKRSGRMDAGYR